jgi:hypothetical protein
MEQRRSITPVCFEVPAERSRPPVS